MRDRLIEATIRLLAEDGPWAVRARSVSAAVGASTTAVYSTFGGMPGLVQAVADEGFTRLGAAFEDARRTDDPAQDAARLALVYRDVARSGPHLFDLMFGLSTPGGHGAARRSGSAAFEAAYGHLVAVARRLVADGRVHEADPRTIAAQLWSFSHGYVTLELSGAFAELEDPVIHVFLGLGTNVLIGLGDTPERAAASGAAAVRAWSAETGRG